MGIRECNSEQSLESNEQNDFNERMTNIHLK